MNITGINKMDSREMNVVGESAVSAAPRPWTKPTLERLSLKDALAGGTHLSNDVTSGTS